MSDLFSSHAGYHKFRLASNRPIAEEMEFTETIAWSKKGSKVDDCCFVDAHFFKMLESLVRCAFT